MILRMPAPAPPTAACTIRGIFRCSLVLTAACVVTVGFAAHSVWSRADKILRQQIERVIAERVPDWDITFADVHANWSGAVRMTDVLLRAKSGEELVELPQVVLDLDMDLLIQHQKVLINKIEIRDALIHAHCDQDGLWNFQGLSKPRPTDMAPADVEIENATVLVTLDESTRWPAAEFRWSNIHARATPESRHGYSAQVAGDLQNVGRIEAAGRADMEHGTWRIAGRCGKVDLEGLMRRVVGISPVARNQMAVLAEATRRGPPGRALQLASLEKEPVVSPPVTDPALADLGLEADVSLEFTAQLKRRGEEPEYSVVAEIRDGQLSNPMLPLAFYGIKGHIGLDNEGLVIKSLTASNGESKVQVDGQWDVRGEAPRRRFVCQAKDLYLGAGIRDYLPPILQQKYDQLQPAGRFNIDVEYDAALKPLPLQLREFSVSQGSLRHELFPFPATGIEGKIRQDNDRLILSFTGFANGRKVILDGATTGVSLEAGLDLAIHVDELPIDALFLDTFRDSRQEKVQKLYPVLKQLNPSGVADWRVELTKSPGHGQKFRLARVRGNISQGGLRYERFPYEASSLTGMVDFDASVENVWHFRDVRGTHGSTSLSGEGFYSLEQPPGLLDLRISAIDMPIDEDLHAATTKAQPTLQLVWEQLKPEGRLDITNLRLLWSPGGPVDLELPGIQFRDARITPAALPFHWHRMNGAARWSRGKLVLHSLQGWHGTDVNEENLTYIAINGADRRGESSDPTAFFMIPGDDGAAWRLHLGDVNIRKLAIDDELRGALPTSLRTVVAHIAPTRPVDLSFGIDLKGFGDRNGPVTAQWRNLKATIPGGNLNLGVAVENARGFLEMTDGRYDGTDVEAVGYVQFEEATVLTLPLQEVRGPFRISRNEIIVGSPSWSKLEPYREEAPLAGQQLVARLYNGQLGVDASADLIASNPENSIYAADVKLKDAQLAQWAKANGYRTKYLSGDVSGEVIFKGMGSDATRITGNGYVQISQARLYELPAVARIFQMVSFQQPENTAFRYAFGEFELHDGLFDFKQMGFDGNTVSLLGRGTVGFAGPNDQSIDLHLFTMLQSRIPGLKLIIEQLGRGWIEYHLVGTVSNPRLVSTNRIPLLENTLTGLVRIFEQGQAPRQAPSINGR